MKEYLTIARLVWPLALGMLNNAVLQFVDRAFLARDSMASIEAVLPASMLALVITGFFQSVVAYSGTFVAQYHGAGDRRGELLSYRAGTAIALASGLLAAVFIPFVSPLLNLISANPDVCGRARTYYAIVSFGAFALCGQMAAISYFTGIGNTKLVFAVSLAGNLINIALDPLLIFGLCGFPRLGIAGAAGATVAAAFLQWSMLAFFARAQVKAGVAELKDLVWRILRYGVPSGAYSVLNILSFTIFVFITGRVGDLDFAVSNACFSINYLLIAPMEGFAVGASTLVGQAQGRRDSAAARLALKRTLILALGVVAALSMLVVLFHKPVLGLFAPTEEAFRTQFFSLGFVLVLWMAAWQIFDAADVVISGALKGAGDTKFVMWWMIVVAFLVWLPIVGLVKVFHNTMPALWATMVVYVVVISIGSAIRWRRGKWAKIELI